MKITTALTKHRAHDYRRLIRRWRAVARDAGLAMHGFASTPEHEVYFLKSKSLAVTGGIYISAGIHGDEPAGSEALVAWAEKNARTLSRLPCLFFPCLNPWGLVNNVRANEAGLDLNRCFHRNDVPVICAMKSLIAPHRFAVALMLHEDYDGQGLYLYENARARPFWAERLIAAGRPVIPIERRTRIDGRKPAAPGIVRRKFAPKSFASRGFPEAIYFHLHHSERTFTIETPSEFALDQRVAAQGAIIGACVKACLCSKAVWGREQEQD